MDTTTHQIQGDSATHEYVPSPQEIAVGHELRDTHLRPIFVFTVYFVVSVTLVIFLVIGIQKVMNAMQDEEYKQTNEPHPWVTNVKGEGLERVPPGPLIEPSRPNDVLPHEDLKLNRDREQKLLHTGGMVDFDSQIVRVPLDAVTADVVENGIPNKLPATQPSGPGAVPPGSSMYGPGGVP